MGRIKIDYGIDLGTTNSAIARIENGVLKIIKSDTLKDTMPSCVGFNKKKATFVGDSAYNQLDRDYRQKFTNPDYQGEVFTEFKRTMGSDKHYFSSHMSHDYSSEELSAEILIKLKSFVTDEKVNSIVITVPAKFTINQKDATVRAAKMSGFECCELIQEPVAASLAFGLESDIKDGFWIVFDFGGGTFDSALMKVEDGIMRVIDTEGDNFLGGKNLDYAIIDEILIPYLKDNYSIEGILEDPERLSNFRNEWKNKVEEAKIQLSFKDKVDLLTDLNEDYGSDDTGTNFELDLTLTRSGFETVAIPIFQKAINITNDLLMRNNLTESNLGTLILVGGPTYTPILRKMLKEQITKNVNTSVDPMTVVARGAALYASTVDIPSIISDITKDTSKLQLDLKYESASVESSEFLSIKLNAKQPVNKLPDKLYVELVRGTGDWSSQKLPFNVKGEVVELQLEANKPNQFLVNVYDEQGNKIPCEPNDFIILQGFKHGQTGATLPYHIGIEIHDEILERNKFLPIKGLEKNVTAPVTGTVNDKKTPRDLRPGITSDYIEIPIYQGDYIADGTKSFYNSFVANVRITGDDIPAFVPANSDINITIKVKRDEQMSFSAYFPIIDYSYDVDVKIAVTCEIDGYLLRGYIEEARDLLEEIASNDYEDKKTKIITELDDLIVKLEQGGSDYDRKIQVLDGLRRQQREIDIIEQECELPKLIESLKQTYFQLEELISKIVEHNLTESFKMDRVKSDMAEFKQKIDAIVKDKSKNMQTIRHIKELISRIEGLDFALRDIILGGKMELDFLNHFNQRFGAINWKDSNKARSLINKGLNQAQSNPSRDELSNIVSELFNLLPMEEQTRITEG